MKSFFRKCGEAMVGGALACGSAVGLGGQSVARAACSVVAESVSGVVRGACSVTGMAVMAMTLVLSATPSIFAEVTIPDTGVEVDEYIVAAIAAVGLVAGAAIGGNIAYTILKRALRWVRVALT